MPKKVTIEEARREIAEVENALFDGAESEPIPGRRIKGALRLAAERLGVDLSRLTARVGRPRQSGGFFRRYGLRVDWAIKPTSSPIPATDPIEVRRWKDRALAAEAILKERERELVDAQDIRAGVLGLTQEPLKPQIVIPTDRGNISRGGRTCILHLSDVHYGEVISLDEMDGLNRYDTGVAKARLGRFFSRAADLMTRHWKGDPPEEIVLCLGGDLISGNLHPELAQTNFPTVPETVREVAEHIAGGITLLRNEVKRPIRVKSVPGNHGRSTDKPQSKRRSASSLDLLAADFCEAVLSGNKSIKDVAFYKASSPDVYFSVYGWHWLLTHGDAAGFRGGGTGYIGPVGTIVKAHRKLVDVSWRSAKPVHYVLTGHWHTTCKTTFGWGNGSVIGYGEFARDLRADPEVARQNFLVVHPQHGVIADQPIYLGVQEEGSLYAGPASVVRPTFDPRT